MTALERADLHAAIEQRYPDNTSERITPELLRDGLHEIVDSAFITASDEGAVPNVPLYDATTDYAKGYTVRYPTGTGTDAFYYSLRAGKLPAPTGASTDVYWKVVPGPVGSASLSQQLTLAQAKAIQGSQVVAGRDYIIDCGPDANGKSQLVTVRGVSGNKFDVAGTLDVAGVLTPIEAFDVATGTWLVRERNLAPAAGYKLLLDKATNTLNYDDGAFSPSKTVAGKRLDATSGTLSDAAAYTTLYFLNLAPDLPLQNAPVALLDACYLDTQTQDYIGFWAYDYGANQVVASKKSDVPYYNGNADLLVSVKTADLATVRITVRDTEIEKVLAKKANLDNTNRLPAEELTLPGYGLIVDNTGRHAIDDGPVYPNENRFFRDVRVNPATGQFTTVRGWNTIIYQSLPKLSNFNTNIGLFYAVWQGQGSGSFRRAWAVDPITGQPVQRNSTISPTDNFIDPLDLAVSLPAADLPKLHVFTKGTLYDDTALRTKVDGIEQRVTTLETNGAGSTGIATPNSTALVFTQNAIYKQLFSGTCTVDVTGAVVGKVVFILLGPACTAPDLSNAAFVAEPGATFTAGKTNRLAFLVLATNLITYNITPF